MRILLALTLTIAASIQAGSLATAQTPPTAATGHGAETAPTVPLFDFQEVMIPMRDGVQLQTVVVRPHGIEPPLPILLLRTPYGVPEKKHSTRCPLI